MINTDQAALLELLKASLFKLELKIPSATNWDNVLRIAEKQAIVPLVEASVPDEYKGAWKSETARSKGHYVRVLHEQNKIIQLFKEQNIPTVILKGTASSMYYPAPSCRPMGDVDILVSVDGYEQAKKLLEELGYQFKKEDYRNSTFIGNRIEIELHYHFSAEEKDIEYYISDGLHNAIQYIIEDYSFPGLPMIINGLVLLEHVRQHLVRSGLGLRQIVDWMMYVHSCLDDTTWEGEFKALAQETGLETLAVTLTYMCRKWLGLPDLITWCNEADDELADIVMVRLFADGNFGKEKPITEDVIRQLRKRNALEYLQRSGLVHWEAAKKYSALRPFAWTYQIGRYVRKGFSAFMQGKDVFKGFLSSTEKASMLKRLKIE